MKHKTGKKYNLFIQLVDNGLEAALFNLYLVQLVRSEEIKDLKM